MIAIENTSLESLCIHRVGNKVQDEGLGLAAAPVEVSSEIAQLLTSYFVTPFKSEEYYSLYHESDLSLNEAYAYVSRIFDDPAGLFEQSVNLARHLYESSNHPNIKAGEFYVAYFTDCMLDGETVDAVGLFKSENKDTFLKVFPSGDGFSVESQQGININKLDKGCLIFNTNREEGYVAAVVDNTNRTDARYWFDEFLRVRQRQDDYFNTENMLALCKNYVTRQLPGEFEVTKADQAELLGKSARYFKENERFDLDEFAEDVFGQPEVAESFSNFKQSYERDNDVQLADDFEIAGGAVKKQARAFKSVIKLDRNFHIYVHGDQRNLRRGYDEQSGMNFYQLFFNEEQ
ncbi:MAG: nucleoid-associated protein [Rikenellaceae bacterium]|nr:nucleoid-associated protein [Rikenellaceae bacterium]